jgi:hypothetical protein
LLPSLHHNSLEIQHSQLLFKMNNLPLSSAPNPFMVAPTPKDKVPQLQREATSIKPEKVDPRSACNLLRKAFKRGWEPLPQAQKLQNEYVNLRDDHFRRLTIVRRHLSFLLDTPVGRDLNLITAAGVEFMVHSVMLIGGSKFLQEGLFPGGVSTHAPAFHVYKRMHNPVTYDALIIHSGHASTVRLTRPGNSIGPGGFR